jgi:hypothetical protein
MGFFELEFEELMVVRRSYRGVPYHTDAPLLIKNTWTMLLIWDLN